MKITKKPRNTTIKRWPYYLVAYVIGYIFSILGTGIKSMYYFTPIKLAAFISALLLGNALYQGATGAPRYSIYSKGLKYAIITYVLLVIALNLEKFLLNNYGIDIAPFIGLP